MFHDKDGDGLITGRQLFSALQAAGALVTLPDFKKLEETALPQLVAERLAREEALERDALAFASAQEKLDKKNSKKSPSAKKEASPRSPGRSPKQKKVQEMPEEKKVAPKIENRDGGIYDYSIFDKALEGTILRNFRDGVHSKVALRKAFEPFISDNGDIDVETLRYMCLNLGEKLSAQQTSDFLSELIRRDSLKRGEGANAGLLLHTQELESDPPTALDAEHKSTNKKTYVSMECLSSMLLD